MEKYVDAGNFTILQKMFGVSYMLLSLIGFLVTVIVGIIASLLTKQTEQEKIDTMTLYPLPDGFCSSFPDGYFYSKRNREESDKVKKENVNLIAEDHK